MRPTRVTGPPAVPDAVDRLLRKFEYPRDAVFPSAFVGGGPGGAPTVVVAAADASDLSKSKADYICTGSSDELTLQSVVDLFATFGCLLILTEGTFDIKNTWTVSGATWVRGAGLGATFLIGSVPLGALVSPGTDGKMSDLYVENTSANAAAEGVRMTGERSLLDNVYAFCNGDAAINMAADLTTVRYCYAEGATYGVLHSSGERPRIVDTFIDDVTTGIEISNNRAQVRGNDITASGDGVAGTGDDGVVIGNIITAGGTPISYTGTGNVIDHNVT